MSRGGAMWVFAVVYSSIGFSIYFALGVVAGSALGLTPVVFLATGLLFLLTMLTYAEGASMFRETGGSATFARHAFNELASFVAGWAILIDYLVIVALAAISASHYLEPVPGFGEGPATELGVAIAIVIAVAALNARGITGRGKAGVLAALAFADVALQILIVAVGCVVLWQPQLLTQSLDLFTHPSASDAVYAAVIAMLAYAGIEAAAEFAPDVDVSRRDLRRIVWSGAVTLPLAYAGTAFVALMAVPVVAGPQGPETELGTTYVEAPFLGVVAAFDPAWLSTAAKWLVVAIAVPTLAWAAGISMLGVSRHVQVLALNRQIPSWLGRLDRRYQTPQLAIAICAAIAIGLMIPRDITILAEIYALGATLAIAIAHLSILRLRRLEPDRPRPFRVPWTADRWLPGRMPVPALAGAALSIAAFVSVLVFHDAARWVGGSWMLFGLVAYVVYRRVFERTSLSGRVTVKAADLSRDAPEIAYRTILVPVFGTALDRDVVATAGSLAAAPPGDAGVARSRLDLIYVVEVPLDRALDTPLEAGDAARADAALADAREALAAETELDLTARVLRARKTGAGIVEAAREGPVESIVIGGEPPSPVRGGAVLGGVGGERPPEVGPVTEYVLQRAPCRVLLIAPPAGLDPGSPPPPAGPDAAGGGT